MKQFFFKSVFCFLLSLSFSAYSQLNAKASFMKSDLPRMYAPIKAMAIEEWGSDDSMIVYTINSQADALYFFLTEKVDTGEMVEAIEEWNDDSAKFQRALDALIKEADAASKEGRKLNMDIYNDLFRLRADWTMVKYTYDNQMKAKNSY